MFMPVGKTARSLCIQLNSSLLHRIPALLLSGCLYVKSTMLNFIFSMPLWSFWLNIKTIHRKFQIDNVTSD